MKTLIDKCVTDIDAALATLSDAAWRVIDRNNSSHLRRMTNIAAACEKARECTNEAARLVRQATEGDEANAANEVVASRMPDAAPEQPPQPEASTATGSVAPSGRALSLDLATRRPRACLIGQALVDTSTWKGVYCAICAHLAKINPEHFHDLPRNERFASKRKGSERRDFAISHDTMRAGEEIGGIVVETFGSARLLVRRALAILDAFDVAPDAVRLFIKGEESAIAELKRALHNGEPLPTPTTTRPTTQSGTDRLSSAEQEGLHGQLIAPESDWNPYRKGTQYRNIFERLKQVSPPREDLIRWLTEQREDHNATAAEAAVDVITSPVRNPSCRVKAKGDIRGSHSAQGHLYYVEADAQGQLRAFMRPVPLPKNKRGAKGQK